MMILNPYFFEPVSLGVDLTAYWKLDETTGTRADVFSISDLTDFNSVGFAAGKQSNAAEFVRSSEQRLTTPSNSSLTVGDIDFTFSMWIRPTGTVSDVQGVINKWYDNSEREYCLYLSVFTPNRLSFIVRDAANTTDTSIDSTFDLVADTWYHVVIYHDSVNNELGIIINDGTPVTVSYSLGVYDGSVNPREFSVGCDQDPPVTGNNSYFDGRIDELAMWKRMLTPAEITYLYNSGNGLTYPF